jgi:hypothetical protein
MSVFSGHFELFRTRPPADGGGFDQAFPLRRSQLFSRSAFMREKQRVSRSFGNKKAALIDVWLWQLESVFDEVKGRVFTVEDDFDNIEAEEDFRVIEHPQPREGASCDEFLFVARDGLTRRAKG